MIIEELIKNLKILILGVILTTLIRDFYKSNHNDKKH